MAVTKTAPKKNGTKAENLRFALAVFMDFQNVFGNLRVKVDGTVTLVSEAGA